MAWFFFGISIFQTLQSQSPAFYFAQSRESTETLPKTAPPFSALRYDTLRILPQETEIFLVDLGESLEVYALYAALLERPEAQVRKIFCPNPHQVAQYDTLVRIELPASEYEFYASPDAFFLTKAVLREPQHQLFPKVVVGMPKHLFFQQFPLALPPTAANVVVIVEDEFDQTFYAFQFENEVLTQMQYQGYVD
jgi:hypothetical protein